MDQSQFQPAVLQWTATNNRCSLKGRSDEGYWFESMLRGWYLSLWDYFFLFIKLFWDKLLLPPADWFQVLQVWILLMVQSEKNWSQNSFKMFAGTKTQPDIQGEILWFRSGITENSGDITATELWLNKCFKEQTVCSVELFDSQNTQKSCSHTDSSDGHVQLHDGCQTHKEHDRINNLWNSFSSFYTKCHLCHSNCKRSLARLATRY